MEVFEVGRVAMENWPPRYNIAPTQTAPVIVADGEGMRRLGLMRWGLVPFWADDLSIGNRLINARSETAETKPAFRQAWKRRRCVVPADGFYEWRRPEDGSEKGPRTPFWIHRADGRPLAMAGLWERWEDPEEGEDLHTFTLLTRPATPWMKPLHHRMPVLLPDGEVQHWLTFQGGLPDAAGPELDAHEVSRMVNSPANDAPACIEPVEGGDVVPPEGTRDVSER
ncbi:MAG: SOS response-associated peptidase [Gemmatimonadota bacterium]